MVKLLLVGLWSICTVVGSTWLFAGMNDRAEMSGADAHPAYFGGLDYVKLETLIVPSIEDNRIQGYYVIDTVFTMEAAKKAKETVPMEYLLQDALNEAVFASKDLNPLRLDKFDKVEFQNNLLKRVNDHLGEKIIYEILIQKFDFIHKDEIRDQQIRRS